MNIDGISNITDFNFFLPCFNQPASCANPMAPNTDCNGDGIINISDFNDWVAEFNQVSGPSGLSAPLKGPAPKPPPGPALQVNAN